MSVSYLCTFIFEAVLVQSRNELTCFAVQWRTLFFSIFFFLAISKPLVTAATCNDLFCFCVEGHFFSSYLQTTDISFFPQGSLHKLSKDNDLDSSRNVFSIVDGSLK